jgi:hypothetical protein
MPMSVKRSVFRAAVVALAALAVVNPAVAKKNKKTDKTDAPKGGMMEEGGKDPAETETLEHDEGAYVPGKEKKAMQTQHATDSELGVSAEGEGTAQPEKVVEEKKGPPVARKTIGVFAEGLIGLGRAPVPGPLNASTGDFTTGSATSFGLMIGGHYDFTPKFRILLRVPWTVGTVKNGAVDASTNALGDPELAARLRLTEPGDTEWAVRLGIGIPIAQGNANINDVGDAGGHAQAILQRVADAANGWHDPELYALKRIPISPALLFTHRVNKFRFGGEFKGVFMPKIGGSITQSGSAGTYSLPGVAWSLLLGGNASYEVFNHAHIALAAWARYGFTDGVEYDSPATSPTRFQLVAEPKILAQFGHVVPSIGVVLPIGRQLGGDIIGLRAHVDVVF